MGQKLTQAEYGSIERVLRQMERSVDVLRAELMIPGSNLSSNSPGGIDSDEYLADVARNIYRFRRSRTTHFKGHIFAEPAWDILLNLFEKGVSKELVSVTSVCKASSVPDTTALRWLNILMDMDLVEREPQERDRRTSLVRLTAKGTQAARECIRQHS